MGIGENPGPYSRSGSNEVIWRQMDLMETVACSLLEGNTADIPRS